MRSAKAARFPAPTWPPNASFDPSDDLERLFDRAAEILLIALIAFVPWPFGSVHAWAEEIVIAISGLLALCLTIKLLLAPHSRLVRSWSYLPIAVFLLLALVQLAPMPHAVLHAISPGTLQTKSRLLADLPDAANAPMTLTFYANATRHDLGMVLACVLVFVVSLNVLRTRGRIKRMLIAISTVGGLTILLALAQDMTGTQKLYWTVTKPIPLAVGGPFIGHNDFPLFANLAIGAAVALLMVIWTGRRSSAPHRSNGSMLQAAAALAARWALIAVILLGAAAVFLSLSRSGILALGAAAICIGVAAAYRFRLGLERSLLTACVLIIFFIMFFIASSSINHRLATLGHPFEQYFSRWQIVKDILVGWKQFPLLGTGLGTHEVVYPMFERLLMTGDFNHAENEYAQMLEETGAIGLAAILLFVGILAAAFVRALRICTRSPIGSAIFGLAFGILAVVLQSTLGFGEHVAANAVLTAVECALLINVGRLLDQKTASAPVVVADLPGTAATAVRVGVRLAGAVALLGALGLVLSNADRVRRGQREWEPAKVIFDDYDVSYASVSDEQYADAIIAAGMASLADPDNIQYSYVKALYQWAPIDSRHDPNVPDDVRPLEEKKLASTLVAEFNHVRAICPTFGPAVFMAGQLQYAVLDEPAGYDLLRLSATLAPTNPTVFLELASLQCRRQDYAGAMNTCRYCLSLEGVLKPRFEDIVDILVREAKRPDLAIELAANDADRELAIVTALRAIPDRPEFQTLASTLEKRANSDRKMALMKICQKPDGSPKDDAPAEDIAALADIYRSEKNSDLAIEYYKRALIQDYGQVAWHMNLAQTLLDAGRKDEAVQEAQIVLQLKPGSKAARQFILDATGPGGTSSGQ